ncbi:MAG TPA: type II toxin-antitoxin system RelE/ParE family toxin [Verrucomicrobiota bacterium]|nr:type II toxin-antitoxin system RelE/ParE family toxin [Verrucomicrobiota bacterium]
MKVEFGKAFARDIVELPANVRQRVAQVVECVMNAPNLQAVPNVKKLKGSPNAFRIRVGDYRVGFFLEGDQVTFMRCLSRAAMYRGFP